MTLDNPDQVDNPTSFAASVLWGAENVPRPARQRREASEVDPSESPTHLGMSALIAEIRAEGYVAGRVDGINDASAAIISELDSNVERSTVVGTEARAYKAGLTIAKSIAERVAASLSLAARSKV